jgi:hypothetical protein
VLVALPFKKKQNSFSFSNRLNKLIADFFNTQDFNLEQNLLQLRMMSFLLQEYCMNLRLNLAKTFYKYRKNPFLESGTTYV